MACPLYKSLKNGTSFYAFPSAAESLSASKNNPNYQMYFSNYTLINLPKQNLISGTNSNPIYFDFQNSFYRMNNTGQQATTFGDELIESLRNYVANFEETIRESKLNNTEYYYDNNSLQTTSEKIFWKWCKELNLVDFEPAIDGEQYFANLPEFQSNNLNDLTYFPEILWSERKVKDYNVIQFYQSTIIEYPVNLEIQFSSTTNYKVGDILYLDNIQDNLIKYLNGIRAKILYIIPADNSLNQRAILDLTYTGILVNETSATSTLVYNKLVQYIGNVNGVNNVEVSNRSYTEVYANIASNTGQTPDILFRTMVDNNYNPGMSYPILPSQYQPEIVGAELFNSPIVNTPQNYPGNYYGQFDTIDYTYTTQTGDSIRRSGNYYGTKGDLTNPVINGNTIDGLMVDFDTSHYVKMNIASNVITTFDEFNALTINNLPPSDFEFNAILWYYTVEDSKGNIANNLYGISFLDNPKNNQNVSDVGLAIPTYKKLAANSNQDGTAYSFSLTLNYNIINENPQDTYNPNPINSLFSMNLFNEAMNRLANVNDSFLSIVTTQNNLILELNNVKQLIYSQSDLSLINTKISNLESLLQLYQYTQLASSDTIQVVSNNGTTPPYITLNNIDYNYTTITNVNTTDLYNQSGIIPLNIAVPKNKDFLVRINNNDQTSLSTDNLTLYLGSDLSYKQSVEIFIDSNNTATQNKKVDFYINYSNGQPNQLPVLTKIIESNLPIYYNSYLQKPNLSSLISKFNFNIDMSNNIYLSLDGSLMVPLYGSTQSVFNNTINKGDVFLIEDFIVGTSSTIDFSGQYVVTNVSTTNLYLTFDTSSNTNLISYAQNNITIGSSISINNILVNIPSISVNKGSKYRITNVNISATASFSERYIIEKY